MGSTQDLVVYEFEVFMLGLDVREKLLCRMGYDQSEAGQIVKGAIGPATIYFRLITGEWVNQVTWTDSVVALGLVRSERHARSGLTKRIQRSLKGEYFSVVPDEDPTIPQS